jgi:hypothetical protein
MKTWQDVMLEITETDPADTSDTSNIFISYDDLAAILKAAFQVVDGQNKPKVEPDLTPDLAMMVRRLVLIARKHVDDPHPDLTFANTCLKWLSDKGLDGTPLREGELK